MDSYELDLLIKKEVLEILILDRLISAQRLMMLRLAIILEAIER